MTNTTKKTANLELWDAVCKTDPAHTKKVNQRGGFTAIDAYYQIQNATEQFGKVGLGWGWNIRSIDMHEGGLCVVLLDFWTGAKGDMFSVTGCSQWRVKDRLDNDAPKKATTDAITKALSYLGFNADVFQGKFDDNKYVAQMTEEHNDTPPWKGPLNKTALQTALRGLTTDIGLCEESDTLDALVTASIKIINQCADEASVPHWYYGDGGDFVGLQERISNKTAELANKEIDVRM